MSVLLALSFVSGFLIQDFKMPDPYIGWQFQTFPSKFNLEVQTDGTRRVVHRRRKYIEIGLPFEVTHITFADVKALPILFTPEFKIGNEVIISNLMLGFEQDLPFRGYRSFPSGIFYGLSGGFHYGFIHSAGDLQNSSGRNLDSTQRTSLATVFKFYFGPRFASNSLFDLKLRFEMDWMYGKLSYYQTRTSFSDNLGSTVGVSLQLDFK